MHHEEERMPLHPLLFCKCLIVLLLACATDIVFTDLSLLQKDLFDDFPVLNTVTSPSIGADGRIYACIGSIAKAYNKDGSLAWMARLNESCQFLVSPVLDQNGMVYVAANTRVMIIFYSEEENSVTISDLYNATTLDQNMLGVKPITGLSLMKNSTSVLVNAGPAGLYAVSIDGTLLWSTDGYSSNGESVLTAGTFCPVQDVICYFHFSPAIDYCDGTIYIAHTNGWLYAIDGLQPYVKWEYHLESSANTSVAGVTAGNNGRVYVATVTGSVYVLDTDTGSLLWQVTIGPLSNRTCFPRIDSKGRVILGSLDGFLYVISIDGQRIKRYLHDSAAYSVIHSCPYVDCSKQEVFVAQVSLDAKVTSKSDVSYIAAKGVTIFALDTSNGNVLLFDNYKGETIEDRGDFVLDTSLLLAVFASNQSGAICNNVDSTERWKCAFWSTEFAAGVPAFIGRGIQPVYIALPLSFFVLGLGLLLWFIWLKSYWNNYNRSSDRCMKTYAFPELQAFFQRRALYKAIVSKLEMSLRNDPQSQHLQRQLIKAQEDFYTNEWILSQYSLQQEHSKFPNVDPIQDQMAVSLKYSNTEVPISLSQSADINLTRYSTDETGQTSASQAFAVDDNLLSINNTLQDSHGIAPTSRSSVNPLFLGLQLISSELQPATAAPVSDIGTLQNNALYLDNAFQPLSEASDFNVSHSFTKEADNHHPYLISMDTLAQGNENTLWAEGLESRTERESPIGFQDYPAPDYGFVEGSEVGFQAKCYDFRTTELPLYKYQNDFLEEFQPSYGIANTGICYSLQPMMGQQDPENTSKHFEPGATEQLSEHDNSYIEIPHLDPQPENSGSKEEGNHSYFVLEPFPGSDHLQHTDPLLIIANQGITSEDGTKLPQTTVWLPGFEAGVFDRASTFDDVTVAGENKQLQNLQQGIQDEKEDRADNKPNKEAQINHLEKLQQQDLKPSITSHATWNSIEDATFTPAPDDLILETESNTEGKKVSSPDARSYLMHLPSISEDPEAEAWEANQDEKRQLDLQGTASGHGSDNIMQPNVNNLMDSPLDQPSAEILEETGAQNQLFIFETNDLDTDADHQNLQNQHKGTVWQPTEETSLSTANQVTNIDDHDSKRRELESVSNPDTSSIQRTSSLNPAKARMALLSETTSLNPATDARKSLIPRASSSNHETKDSNSQKITALERIASTDSGTSSYTDASDTESDEDTYKSLDEFDIPRSEIHGSASFYSPGSSFSVMDAAEEQDNNEELHTEGSDTESDEETDKSLDKLEIPWSETCGSASYNFPASSFGVMNAAEDKDEKLLHQESSPNRPPTYESMPRSTVVGPSSEEQFNGKASKIRPLRISRHVLPIPGPPLSRSPRVTLPVSGPPLTRSQSGRRGTVPVPGVPLTRSQLERRGTLPIPGATLNRSRSDRRGTLPIPGVTLNRSQSDRRGTLPIPGVSLTRSHSEQRSPFQSLSPATRRSTRQQSRASVGSSDVFPPVESSQYHPRKSL